MPQSLTQRANNRGDSVMNLNELKDVLEQSKIQDDLCTSAL